jgi:hypothetical protein
MKPLNGDASNNRESSPAHRDETIDAQIPSAFRSCPHCSGPNTKDDASPQSSCVECQKSFTWADADEYQGALSDTLKVPIGLGTLASGQDEGYGGSSALTTPTKPDDTIDPMDTIQPVQSIEPIEPSKSIKSVRSTKPTPNQLGKKPRRPTDVESFLAQVSAAGPSNYMSRRNPKFKHRRPSQSTTLPPANYVPLQPERFPVEDMAAGYAAMAAYNILTNERAKAPRREYQQKLHDSNCWQKFAYRMQCKPCWESSEGCCFMSAERGEDGTGHGHGDGCCVHYGCRDPCCKMGAQHCTGGACCEGCGCVRCCGWEHGVWSLCDNWFAGWTWLCCGPSEKKGDDDNDDEDEE